MEGSSINKSNFVQEYIDEIKEIKVPENEKNILEFLESLDGERQSNYLSFILSQSHIFGPMYTILETYYHNDFYHNAGYNRFNTIVPKLDKDGNVYFEEFVKSDVIDEKCRKILESLQGNDKSEWKRFVKYIKEIYQPETMDIYHNNELYSIYDESVTDFNLIYGEIIENDNLRVAIEELRNKPIPQEKGIFKGIKSFFAERKQRKQIKKDEEKLVDDSELIKRVIELIKKYKGNKKVSTIARRQLIFAEALLGKELPKETVLNIVNGLKECNGEASYVNYRIFNLLKQLSSNAIIAKELYSHDILYADSFQDLSKNIRQLLVKYNLKEDAPILTEYRTMPLRDGIVKSGNVLKGKDFSQDEIKAKMEEYDEEFKEVLAENNPEMYVRRCTDLMMKFISTHPYDDGNGRTARMILQMMLARRGILFPSNIENYFVRQSGTEYSTMEEKCLESEDYIQMENYVVERAKMFNGGQLILNDSPLIFESEQKQRLEERNMQR